MTVGLPGTGIGGMFYMLSALAMPLTEAYRRARGRPAGTWRVVLELIAITGGVLAAIWATGWLVVAALTAARRVMPAAMLHGDGFPAGNVIRTAMLALMFGTLAAVLLGVELLRLWVHRRANHDTGIVDETPERVKRGERRAASAGRRLVLVLLTGTAAVAVTRTAAAQRQSLVAIHLTRADSVFRRGDTTDAAREYAAVLAVDPRNSRATYRLAELRRHDPDEALRLFRRYVTLEPTDAWGYIAVADLLADEARYDDALQCYAMAVRLAPGARDAVVGRAQVLAQAGRTDAAIAAYDHWLAAHPGDAPAWRELGREELRAGRPRDAARALERAEALAPDATVAKHLAAARAAAAPAITPLASGSHDSDGNSNLRLGGLVDWTLSGPTRVGIAATRAHTTDVASTEGLTDLALHVSAQPQTALRLEGAAGATRIDPSGGHAESAIPTGLFRARWRARGTGPAIDVRGQRSVLDATPLLVANRVVRTEVGGMLELPVARSVTIRGLGRVAALSDSIEQNHRASVTGVLALALRPGVEISGQFHEMGYAHPSSAGYFAPRLAQVVEAGSYFELEPAGSALIACDVGVGVQRVAAQGAPVGAWRPAFRLYSLISVPLAPGRDLRFEFNGEDSAFASEAATTERWRYVSAAVSLRWAM